MSNDKWRPIETAPKKKWVLACPQNGIMQIVRLDDPESRWSWWDGSGYYKYKTFTHWRELPEPPGDE